MLTDIWNGILDSVIMAHPNWDPELIADEAEKDYAGFIQMMEDYGPWQ